jgi:succinate-semialdehyde dehydrogenase/glutarate-semialdehyde dehydrogenase
MLTLTDASLLRSQLYIDGKWVDADSGATMDVLNPATKEEVIAIPNAGADETRRAIEAADRAFSSWRNVVAKERSAVLKRWFQLIMENQEDLAQLMTAEQGKPLAESRGEVAYGASFV